MKKYFLGLCISFFMLGIVGIFFDVQYAPGFCGVFLGLSIGISEVMK